MRMMNKMTGLALLIVAWAMASSAMAVTQANTVLTAQAKLTYQGNSTGINASVTVTVQLVPAPVSFAATFTPPGSSVNKAVNDTYAATYTVQSNANGPDTYSIATSYTATNDVANPLSPTTSVPSVRLGATAAAAAAAAGATTITVPSDGVADSDVNGIAANDTVIIDNKPYHVASVGDSASGTSTITLATGLQTAVALGDGIFEYKAFTVNIQSVGSQGSSGTNYVLDLQTSVTSNKSPTPANTYTSNVTITIVAITLNKYVRDVSNPCTTGCTGGATYKTKTYYADGVQAKPSDTLEYLLVVQTTTAGINNAVITDLLPAYTSYVAGSTKVNGTAVTDPTGTSTAFPLDSANGGLSLGSLNTNATSYVTYQIKVAP